MADELDEAHAAEVTEEDLQSVEAATQADPIEGHDCSGSCCKRRIEERGKYRKRPLK